MGKLSDECIAYCSGKMRVGSKRRDGKRGIVA